MVRKLSTETSLHTTKTICSSCGTGCGLAVELKDNKIILYNIVI
ncbi:hypothetical protein [Niallia endozanthoxylica]|uniref:4Fe-4S Mo/W bis-MGD-type domain-containing protein n=1 Tax=Niallia endozanthoxylica TaxID=2036016 RepID=A0A5J5I079_9BACI|nr:hypothetical protein F4V44_06765 [Niallia endozanthoxylica]